MTGLDSNVLLRWIIDDPTAPLQAAIVRERLASEPGPLFVNSVVLAETVWVLRRRAKLRQEEVANVVDGLINAPTVRLQQPDAVADALASFLKHSGGFADHLIGEINRHAGCKTTLTFDKAASKSPLFAAIIGD
jgi:predicted nucleic-acid-binding protein